MRVAACLFPEFALQRAVLRRPVLAGAAFALVDDASVIGEVAQVWACSQPALQGGVFPGMSVGAARRRFAGLELVRMSTSELVDELQSVADLIRGRALRVRVVPPDELLIELHGARLDAEAGEGALLALWWSTFRAAGLPVRIAAADAPRTARILARHGDRALRQLPRGAARSALGRLPIAALFAAGNGVDVLDSLLAMGVRRIEDFAALRAADVARRFGPEALGLHRVARGREPEGRLQPLEAPERIEEWVHLPEPTHRPEAIEGWLKMLGERVEQRLFGREAEAVAPRVSLVHAEGVLGVEGLGSPVTHLELGGAWRERREWALQGVASSHAWAGGAAPPPPDLWARFCARLHTLGPLERPVHRLRVEAGVRPRRALDAAAGAGAGGLRGLRMLREGRPLRRGEQGTSTLWLEDQSVRCVGVGPRQRLEGQWWNDASLSQDYYLVHLEDGRRWWVSVRRASRGLTPEGELPGDGELRLEGVWDE